MPREAVLPQFVVRPNLPGRPVRDAFLLLLGQSFAIRLNQMHAALVIAAIAALPLHSLSTSAATAQEQVTAINVERLHALATGDMPRLERLFADDFVYITPAGKVETKDDFRKEIAGGYKLPFVEPENLRVRVHGPVAVVTYTTRRLTAGSTKPVESISTCVYVRDDTAGWQLVSQQTNRISP